MWVLCRCHLSVVWYYLGFEWLSFGRHLGVVSFGCRVGVVWVSFGCCVGVAWCHLGVM